MAVERVKDFFTLLAGVCPFAVKPGVKACLHGLSGPDQDSLKEQRKEKQKTRTGWFAFSVM